MSKEREIPSTPASSLDK